MDSTCDYKSQLEVLIYEQRFLEKFLSGSSCCVICFDCNPLVLEEHHVAGKNNSDLTITVCANHHAILSRMQRSWDERWLHRSNSQNVKETFLLRGLSDVLRLKSDYVLEPDGDGC